MSRLVKICLPLVAATSLMAGCYSKHRQALSEMEEQLAYEEMDIKLLRHELAQIKKERPPMGETVLDRTVIPRVTFKKADNDEIVGFIRKVIEDGQPPTPKESVAKRKTLIATIEKEIAALEAQIDQPNITNLTVQVEAASGPRVLLTVDSTDVTLRELLEFLCYESGIEYELRNGTLIIRNTQPKDSGE